MTIFTPDRFNQLRNLIPSGFPYRLRGALLAKKDRPYEIPFSGLESNFLYDLYVNDVRGQAFTSDNDGELLVSVRLEPGNDYELKLFPVGGTELGQKRIWVSVRNWATFHEATSESVGDIDQSIAIIYDGLRLDTAAIDELNNYHGRNVWQSNSSNYGSGTFRETLRILRNAYLNEGGSIDGIRDAVASRAFINPLILSGRELPIWWLDQELSDDFKVRSRFTSNDLDELNVGALRALGSIDSDTLEDLVDIHLFSSDNLNIEFSPDWDGGDIVIEGTTKFGVEVEEIVTSNPGSSETSNFSYIRVARISRSTAGTAGTVYFGYANEKFVKVTEISSFTDELVTNTLEYRPSATPTTESFLLNGNVIKEQSNNLSDIRSFRFYFPRKEAELMSTLVEPFNLLQDRSIFSFEIDGRGIVDIDFSDYFTPGGPITPSMATAAQIVDVINSELSSIPTYGASYSNSALVVSTLAGPSFKIVGNSNSESSIDQNGRDLGSFITIHYSGYTNDFSNYVFNSTLTQEGESLVFFGYQSKDWFDVEVNYQLKPDTDVSSDFQFIGPSAPDNFIINGATSLGYRRSSYSFNPALVLEASGGQFTIEKEFSRILEKKGQVITLEMLVSIGNASLSITSPFQAFVSFDNGSQFFSFNDIVGTQPIPVPIGTVNYEVGGYHQTFVSRLYIPVDAVSAIVRIEGNGFSSGDLIIIEEISIFDTITNSKFLDHNTVTRGPSYNFLRSEVYAWFPEEPSSTEIVDIGFGNKEGHIQRIKPSNTVFDTINATERNFSRVGGSVSGGEEPSITIQFDDFVRNISQGDWIEFTVLTSNTGSVTTLTFEALPVVLDGDGLFVEWDEGNIPGSIPIPLSNEDGVGTPLPGQPIPFVNYGLSRLHTAIQDEVTRRQDASLPVLLDSTLDDGGVPILPPYVYPPVPSFEKDDWTSVFIDNGDDTFTITPNIRFTSGNSFDYRSNQMSFRLPTLPCSFSFSVSEFYGFAGNVFDSSHQRLRCIGIGIAEDSEYSSNGTVDLSGDTFFSILRTTPSSSNPTPYIDIYEGTTLISDVGVYDINDRYTLNINELGDVSFFINDDEIYSGLAIIPTGRDDLNIAFGGVLHATNTDVTYDFFNNVDLGTNATEDEIEVNAASDSSDLEHRAVKRLNAPFQVSMSYFWNAPIARFGFAIHDDDTSGTFTTFNDLTAGIIVLQNDSVSSISGTGAPTPIGAASIPYRDDEDFETVWTMTVDESGELNIYQDDELILSESHTARDSWYVVYGMESQTGRMSVAGNGYSRLAFSSSVTNITGLPRANSYPWSFFNDTFLSFNQDTGRVQSLGSAGGSFFNQAGSVLSPLPIDISFQFSPIGPNPNSTGVVVALVCEPYVSGDLSAYVNSVIEGIGVRILYDGAGNQLIDLENTSEIINSTPPQDTDTYRITAENFTSTYNVMFSAYWNDLTDWDNDARTLRFSSTTGSNSSSQVHRAFRRMSTPIDFSFTYQSVALRRYSACLGLIESVAGSIGTLPVGVVIDPDDNEIFSVSPSGAGIGPDISTGASITDSTEFRMVMSETGDFEFYQDGTLILSETHDSRSEWVLHLASQGNNSLSEGFTILSGFPAEPDIEQTTSYTKFSFYQNDNLLFSRINPTAHRALYINFQFTEPESIDYLDFVGLPFSLADPDSLYGDYELTLNQSYLSEAGNTEIIGTIIDNSTLPSNFFSGGESQVTSPFLGYPSLPEDWTINVVGVWNEDQFNECTLTNLEIVENSPRKGSFALPANVTEIGPVDLTTESVITGEASGLMQLSSSVDDGMVSVVT